MLPELLPRDLKPAVEPGEHYAERADAQRRDVPRPGAPRRLRGIRRRARALVGEPRLRLGILEPPPERLDLALEERDLRLRGLEPLGGRLGRLPQAVGVRKRMRSWPGARPGLRLGGEQGAI